MSVSGNSISGSGISIEYAVGEPVITTLSSSSAVATQGLLQPIINITIPVPLSPGFQVPNSFSPNHDNINDVWHIPSLESGTSSNVFIFDRYGREVYRCNGKYVPWNGSTGSKPVPVGLYYYIIEPEAGKKIFSGWLFLTR